METKRLLIHLTAAAIVALSATTAAAGPAETVRLASENGSGVAGTAMVSSPGDGSAD